MEDLRLKTIPSNLLARILLQLHTLPPKELSNAVQILSAGLDVYGETNDLNAYLDYCTSTALNSEESWLWKHYTINNDLDWDLCSSKKPQEIVGMRFLIASETARRKVQLTRFGQKKILDPKCYHLYGDRLLPVDQILQDTLDFLKREDKADALVEKLIGLRLEQYAKDTASNDLDTTDYHLLGALLVRYDSSATEGRANNTWCLYLRDYVNSEEGTLWRIISKDKDEETTITSEQAMADIRGIPDDSVQPSEFSKDYRPVYLFYVNGDKINTSEEEAPTDQHITLDDYTFDDEDEYEYVAEEPPAEENENCKHCGIADIVEDVNDMFFCEMCNLGVHQLCENPPIQAFEKNVDPWYCRACCLKTNTPLPTPPQLDKQTLLQLLSTQQFDLPVKRKHSEEEEESNKK